MSHVQMRDGLKITVRRASLDMALSSTALFAVRYFSRNTTGDLNVHPASAALINTKGLGVSDELEALAVRQSIAVNAV